MLRFFGWARLGHKSYSVVAWGVGCKGWAVGVANCKRGVRGVRGVSQRMLCILPLQLVHGVRGWDGGDVEGLGVDRAGVDDLTKEFLIESGEGLDCMERCLNDLQHGSESGTCLAEIFRTVHTMKGTVGFLGFPRLEKMAHAGEALLVLLRDGKRGVDESVVYLLMQLTDRLRAVLQLIETRGHEGKRDVDDDSGLIEALERMVRGEARIAEVAPAAAASETSVSVGEIQAGRTEQTVRVEVETLNRLMNLVGDLVQTRNQFLQAEVSEESFALLGQRLDGVTASLRETVMQARMQPVGHLFQRIPRLARDVAAICGKRVRLEFSGGATGLDKSLLETLKDPLAHAVRNAIDHGVESARERLKKGKTAEGRIELRAFHEGGQIVVEVKDDGAGVDCERVVRRAVERGLIAEDRVAAMSEAEKMELLFAAGFSTSDEVTMISGRGVGLDVVRANVERIGGSVELLSVRGEGATLRMRVPLTLAIVPALIANCGGQMFAVPHSTLLEMVVVMKQDEAAMVKRIGSAKMYLLRDRLVPLLDLSEMLGIARNQERGYYIAILEAKGRQFGLIVDDMAEPQEIVVKPLSSVLSGLGIYSGATILGDGKIALILDATGMAKRARLCETGDVEALAASVKSVEVVTSERKRAQMLAFANHRLEPTVVPLDCVERIERVEPDAIERLAGERVMQYRDELVVLEDAGGLWQELRDGSVNDAWLVLICRRSGKNARRVGLVVRDALDVLDGELMDVDGGAVVRTDGRLAMFHAGFEMQRVVEDARLMEAA